MGVDKSSGLLMRTTHLPVAVFEVGHLMRTGNTVYFDSPGEKNTDQVIDIVADRVKNGGPKHVVVASGTGETAKKMLSKLRGSGAAVAVVTYHCGADREGENTMSPDTEKGLVEQGAKIVRASHALSGIERSFTKKLGGPSRVETVAEALRSLFGQGMKVCVEITVMAADSGAIPCGDLEVISIGGTEAGADTACIVRPAHANDFFKLEVREILAIPRTR